MDNFELNILSCGSATPTTRHLPTSQVLNFREKLFMIDCGEGTQLELRKARQKFSRLNHIFISHIHGDHCFGLPGLISTFGLLKRTGDLVIHAHKDVEAMFKPMIDSFSENLPFEVRFNHIDPNSNSLIYEDRSLKVHSIPLMHRMPTCGFLFEEKQKERHLRAEMISFWKIPIKDFQLIKEGADWISPDGTVVPNKALTKDAEIARKYAYCSDTAYNEKIIPIVEGADLLFHEATFAETEAVRAKQTFHSTARQAATIAKEAKVKQLMIGHFSARYDSDQILLDEAVEVFENTVLANEGLLYKI